MGDSISDDNENRSVPPSGKGGKSKEIERFLIALKQYGASKGSHLVTVNEIYSIADDIELRIEDLRGLIENLNDAGDE